MNPNKRSKSFAKEGNNFLKGFKIIFIVLNSKFKIIKIFPTFANEYERSFVNVLKRLRMIMNDFERFTNELKVHEGS
jgi:hypothetical protein